MSTLIERIKAEIDEDVRLANGEDEQAHNERHWAARIERQAEAFKRIVARHQRVEEWIGWPENRHLFAPSTAPRAVNTTGKPNTPMKLERAHLNGPAPRSVTLRPSMASRWTRERDKGRATRPIRLPVDHQSGHAKGRVGVDRLRADAATRSPSTAPPDAKPPHATATW